MDIIFQSGDFYNQSDFWTTYIMPFLGIFIPAMIAVLLFNEGIKKERELDVERRKKDKVIQNEESNRKLMEFGNYFLAILEACFRVSKLQIEAYKDLTEGIDENPMGNYSNPQFTHEDLNRLITMDTARILEFFEKRNVSLNDFILAIHQIDYLHTVFNKIPENISEGEGKRVFELKKEFTEICVRIQRIIQGTIYEANYNNRKDEIISVLNRVWGEYCQSHEAITNVGRDYKDLICPLIEEFNKDKYYRVEEWKELYELLQNASNIALTIQVLNQNISQNIRDHSVPMCKSLGDLAKVNDKLKPSNIKTE